MYFVLLIIYRREYIFVDHSFGHNFKRVSFLSLPAGSDAILLGAETLRGLYPVETISTVGRICCEVGFIVLF
jgi:hypothetical protein